ncbi:MAG: PCRF domain-containing protein, partial [Fibrobacteraceae bacterium]|nr:PCRF domain-containing protein [Fibrobacteraceae bacterium]
MSFNILLNWPSMQDAAKKVIEKYEELETELASPEVVSNQSLYTKLQKQYKGLEKTVAKAREFVQLSSDLKEWKKALGGNDAEFIEAAKEE